MTEAKLVHVVDDEEEICRSTAFLLQVAGMESRCWLSGSSFLHSADVGREGCVILDLRMPDKDGFEVQRELAARQSCLKVIMVSGHADGALARKAIDAGAFAFIEKPYDEASLLMKVEQALSISGR